MQKFNYYAKDKEGVTKRGVVEARDAKQAARVLREKEFLVISLNPKGKEISVEVKEVLFRRVSSSDRVNFTRQLSTMITAGLPITESLSILELQSRPTMAKVVGEVLREVESGGSLASALERHSDAFDQTYVALVKAGEAAGVLDKVLSRLADNLEKDREFNSRIKSAMIYPAIVIGGMVIVAAIMIIFVIPKLMVVYSEFQAELPLMTKILLRVSQFAAKFWWLGLIFLAGLVAGMRVLATQPEFKKYYDQFLFKIPLIGKLRRQIILTEFTRTLGLLVGAGILLVEALNIVRRSMGSLIYEKAIETTASEVEKGLSLAVAIARTEVFPPILPQMIAVGEETGKIDEVLAKVSAYFEQESDLMVKGLTAALEPLIMIVLGVGVGFLIIAVIMPIYNLTSKF